MNEELYTLLIVDGNINDVNCRETSVIRFNHLDRDAVFDLAELSMLSGYSVALWLEDVGGTGCGEAL